MGRYRVFGVLLLLPITYIIFNVKINLINRHKGKRPTTSPNRIAYTASVCISVPSSRTTEQPSAICVCRRVKELHWAGWRARCRCSALHLYSHQAVVGRCNGSIAHTRHCAHTFYRWVALSKCICMMHVYKLRGVQIFIYIFITCNGLAGRPATQPHLFTRTTGNALSLGIVAY